jgi:phospholipase C
MALRNTLTAVFAAGATALAAYSASGAAALPPSPDARHVKTATPIKHLVVIFQENVSFDHYFGTYPNALNLPGETPFHAAADTPTSINTLAHPLDPTNNFQPLSGVDLLNNNPNFTNTANGSDAANPFRLAPSQAATQDMGHNYMPEQQASDNGLMDLFPKYTGTAGPPPGSPVAATTKGLVMAYYDGNTVTALWNYAQNFALNDNSYTTTFGPSTPGAINLISGQTNGFAATNGVVKSSHETPDGNGGLTLIGDADPLNDVCSTGSDQVLMAGKNIGDLLNEKGITWGSFMGGFDLTVTNPNGTTGCGRQTNQTVANAPYNSNDYIPHHAWFQYYASTANPTHARPGSVQAVGHTYVRGRHNHFVKDPANHEYDLHDFFDAVKAGNFPAVSFLKAPAYQDGHAGYSNPIDEQAFVIQVINFLEQQPEWSSTAVVIAYDDSDGWYDHQMSPVLNPSSGVADALNGSGVCSHGAQQGTETPATALLGVDGKPAMGRCGYGTRMPLLVISPYAKKNYVDHTLTDQSSVLKFVEDNWLHGERIQPGGSFDTVAGPIDNMLDFSTAQAGSRIARKLVLDPQTGEVVAAAKK